MNQMIFIWETETVTFREIIRKMIYQETEVVIFKKYIPFFRPVTILITMEGWGKLVRSFDQVCPIKNAFRFWPLTERSGCQDFGPVEAQQRYFAYCPILVAIVSENLFVFVFWGVAQSSRDMQQMGYRTDVPVQNEVPTGGITPFWWSANLPLKVSRDMGYRSNSIAISRDVGPLSSGSAGWRYVCKSP